MKNIIKKSFVTAGLIGGVTSSILMVINSLLSLVPFLSCCLCPFACLFFFLLPLLTGLLSAHLAKVKKDDIVEAIKQGALAGLIMGTIGGIINFMIQIISAVFSVQLYNSFSMFENNSNSLEKYFSDSVNFVYTLMTGFVLLIIIILVDGFFGLLGGLIRGLIGGNFPQRRVEDAVIVKDKSKSKRK